MFKKGKGFMISITIFFLVICIIGIIFVKNQNKNSLNNDNYNYRISSDYLNYLSLSEEDKEKVSVIPSKYDYALNDSVTSVGMTTLPEQFDLRDVDGNNYITPNKNQKSRGICWAFSAVSVMENAVM